MPRLELNFLSKGSSPRKDIELQDDVPDERTQNPYTRHASNIKFAGKLKAPRKMELRFDSPLHNKPLMRTQVIEHGISNYYKWNMDSSENSPMYK
jgi:hypothetical protein